MFQRIGTSAVAMLIAVGIVCAQSQQTAHGQYGDFRVGVDLTVLKPFFEDGQNPGTGMMGILAEDVPTGTENAVSGFNMKVAPRINGRFIGENGLGFKSSLWIYDHSGESLRTDFTTFGPNASVLIDTSMRFVSLDMEITQEITPGDWAITFGGGFRYAHAELNGTEETFINSYVTKTATIESQKQFDGFGPMLSVDALRPLAGSNLSLFARGKAAVVYGSNAGKVGFDFNVATVPVIQETITEEFDDFLPVFETQVGIAYQKSLGRNWNVATTLAMESQLWSGVGGYQGLIESQDELSVLYQNSGGFAASDGDIGFLGFTVGFEISH